MIDKVEPMPFSRNLPEPPDDSYHPTAAGFTMFVDTIDDNAADTIMKYLEASDASMRATQLRVLGGAMARVPADATAFAHRASRIMVIVVAFYEAGQGPARGVGPSVCRCARPGQGRRVRQLRGRRGRGGRASGVSGQHLGPTGGPRGSLRSDEPLPAEPEHPTRPGRGRWTRLSGDWTGPATMAVMTEIATERPAGAAGTALADLAPQLKEHRRELTGYCYRMLGSAFEAEDAVQETMSGPGARFDRFEGRSSAALVALPHRHQRVPRHARRSAAPGPPDGPRRRRHRPTRPLRQPLPRSTWIEPCPMRRCSGRRRPREVAVARETIRLAFVAALQHLPPRQRAVLILREVLRWQADEVAELLETTVASVNSALQRARATLGARAIDSPSPTPRADARRQALLDSYVDAFERYDMDSLAALLPRRRHDVDAAVRPVAAGPRRDRAVVPRPGRRVRALAPGPARRRTGRRLRPVHGDRTAAWSRGRSWSWRSDDGRIGGLTFFLDTERFFPLFGLPPQLQVAATEADDLAQPGHGQQLVQLGRRATQPQPASEPLRGELHPRQRIDGRAVRIGHAGHVAHHDVRPRPSSTSARTRPQSAGTSERAIAPRSSRTAALDPWAEPAPCCGAGGR